MNANYLLEAKGFAFGRDVEINGLPLLPALIVGLRTLGLPANVALGASTSLRTCSSSPERGRSPV